MNNKRRSRLKQAKSYLEIALDLINGVVDEEEESLDNIPENMADGERAIAMQENIDALSDAADDIETAISTVDEVSWK